jgi:hypothetical protein
MLASHRFCLLPVSEQSKKQYMQHLLLLAIPIGFVCVASDVGSTPAFSKRLLSFHLFLPSDETYHSFLLTGLVTINSHKCPAANQSPGAFSRPFFSSNPFGINQRYLPLWVLYNVRAPINHISSPTIYLQPPSLNMSVAKRASPRLEDREKLQYGPIVRAPRARSPRCLPVFNSSAYSAGSPSSQAPGRDKGRREN